MIKFTVKNFSCSISLGNIYERDIQSYRTLTSYDKESDREGVYLRNLETHGLILSYKR